MKNPYHILEDPRDDEEGFRCPVCRGEGTIVMFGEIEDCPECDGSGYIEIEPPDPMDVYHERGDF